MAGISHTIHYGEVNRLLRSPTSAVARDMLRRGVRVQAQARRYLGGTDADHPKRVNTGNLRSTVYALPVVVDGAPGCRVGSRVWYASLVHSGTGLYGPRHRMITPKRGKVLVFRPKGSNRVVYARKVRGMKPNPFLKDALIAAKY